MRNVSYSSQIGRRRRRFSPALASKILLLVLSLLLVACAGINAAANHAPAHAPASTPTFTSTSGNDLLDVVEQKPAPGAITVHVTEVEFAIIPSLKTFQPGVPYYFVVTNKGKQTHAFTFVPTPDGSAPIATNYQYTHTLIDLDTIPPGTTQTINFTFTPAEAGPYEMACRMRNHYMAGMHIPVVVV